MTGAFARVASRRRGHPVGPMLDPRVACGCLPESSLIVTAHGQLRPIHAPPITLSHPEPYRPFPTAFQYTRQYRKAFAVSPELPFNSARFALIDNTHHVVGHQPLSTRVTASTTSWSTSRQQGSQLSIPALTRRWGFRLCGPSQRTSVAAILVTVAGNVLDATNQR